MSLKRNVAANYLGQGWRALVSIAFVPLYVRYLGMEAYGLIGIFAILQGWLALLDMGMKPALTREMARFSAGAIDARHVRNLLRSVEILAAALGLTTSVVIWAVSTFVAERWLNAQQLDTSTVARAVALMGAVASLKLLESVYVASVTGLQRQVLENGVGATMATIRSAGAAVVLIWVSPTITAFFIWQGLMSVVTVSVYAIVTHRLLPASGERPRFSLSALREIRRFAAGMTVITLLALLLTNVDKLILSRLVSLTVFGYYALAGTAAGVVALLAVPIANAFYPRFVELAARDEEGSLAHVYHWAAQLVSVMAGVAAVMLIFFGDRLLFTWTADRQLAAQVAPLLAVLALGSLLNALMWVPYHLQLAHGWTRLSIYTNIVAVALLVPAIFVVTPRYGPLGAAWVWVILNVGYIIFCVRLMHRRLLRHEMWRWSWFDTLMPVSAAAAVAALCRRLLPHFASRFFDLTVLCGAGALILAAACVAAPLVRRMLAPYARIGLSTSR